MKRSYLHIGRALLAFGTISIFLGIITFFPVFSYKPWFAGWSARIACPIWNGAVALTAGLMVLLAERDHVSRFLREVGFILAIVNLMASPLQFGIALAAILIGPSCYYTLAGVSGTGYLGFVVQFPYRYTLPTICTDPPLYEYYHLVLQLISLTVSVVMFTLSLAFCIRLAVRFNTTGALTVRTVDFTPTPSVKRQQPWLERVKGEDEVD
ncbi:transmembrane protein 212-like [Cetorhinus maximus]